MPWKETCSMDKRVRLIALWNEGQMTVSELGRAFGISRKTVCKWLGPLRAGRCAGAARQCANSAPSSACDARSDRCGVARASQR